MLGARHAQLAEIATSEQGRSQQLCEQLQESTQQLASSHRQRESLKGLLADVRRRSRNAAAVHKSTLAGLRADVAALAAAASDEVSNVGMVADLALRRLAEAEAKAARGENSRLWRRCSLR